MKKRLCALAVAGFLVALLASSDALAQSSVLVPGGSPGTSGSSNMSSSRQVQLNELQGAIGDLKAQITVISQNISVLSNQEQTDLAPLASKLASLQNQLKLRSYFAQGLSSNSDSVSGRSLMQSYAGIQNAQSQSASVVAALEDELSTINGQLAQLRASSGLRPTQGAIAQMKQLAYSAFVVKQQIAQYQQMGAIQNNNAASYTGVYNQLQSTGAQNQNEKATLNSQISALESQMNKGSSAVFVGKI